MCGAGRELFFLVVRWRPEVLEDRWKKSGLATSSTRHASKQQHCTPPSRPPRLALHHSRRSLCVLLCAALPIARVLCVSVSACVCVCVPPSVSCLSLPVAHSACCALCCTVYRTVALAACLSPACSIPAPTAALRSPQHHDSSSSTSIPSALPPFTCVPANFGSHYARSYHTATTLRHSHDQARALPLPLHKHESNTHQRSYPSRLRSPFHAHSRAECAGIDTSRLACVTPSFPDPHHFLAHPTTATENQTSQQPRAARADGRASGRPVQCRILLRQRRRRHYGAPSPLEPTRYLVGNGACTLARRDISECVCAAGSGSGRL
jgi:hypothetical protein